MYTVDGKRVRSIYVILEACVKKCRALITPPNFSHPGEALYN